MRSLVWPSASHNFVRLAFFATENENEKNEFGWKRVRNIAGATHNWINPHSRLTMNKSSASV